jgi:hypothetical protein
MPIEITDKKGMAGVLTSMGCEQIASLFSISLVLLCSFKNALSF